MLRKRALIGAGRFAEEVKCHIETTNKNIISEAARLYLGGKNMICFVEDEFYKEESHVYKLSSFVPEEYEVLIAIGDPIVRDRIKHVLPTNTSFFTFIHPSAQILDPSTVEIGEGSFIGANCVLTTNIKLGSHAELNIGTVIGHDCNIGSYFTTAPGAKISGSCNIGRNVYVGSNASIKQGLSVTSLVTIGMNSAVIKDIDITGIYAGCPARRI